MLIKNISIDNVLTFKNQTIQLDGAPFLTAIGPNGSGKSNFIEILSKIIERVIVVPVKIDDQELWNRKLHPQNTGRFKPFITEHEMWRRPLDELEPNIDIGDEITPSVEILVSLSEHELNIVDWIAENRKTICEILRISGLESAYGHLSHLCHAHDDDNIKVNIRNRTSIVFRCMRKELRWTTEGFGNTFQAFYIRWFKALRWISQLTTEYPEISILQWPLLHDLVVVFGSQRGYHDFSNQFTIQRSAWSEYASLADRSTERSTRQVYSDEPASFELFRRDVCRLIGDLSYDIGIPSAIEKVLAMPNIKKINQKLQEFLDLEVSFSAPIRRDPNIRFIFKRNGRELFVYRLSSGEKALLHLIFSVHWSGSRNIMLLIDEPELHLHPPR